MLQSISELNFTPSQQPEYRKYRKYFKILDICTDENFNVNLLRSQYQKLKLLFSQTTSNALYSLDSTNSYISDLDEAYKNLYEYLTNIHKKTNSPVQEPQTQCSINTDRDFPFSGQILESNINSNSNNLTSTLNNFSECILPSSNIQQSFDTESNSNYTNNQTSPTPTTFTSSSLPVYSSTPDIQKHIPSEHVPENRDERLLNILANSDLRLGSTYKCVREYLQISLEDIQNKTKISTYYLNSIENNNFANFQALIFLKGFFKAYLKYLNIPKQEECTNIYINNARAEFYNNR